VGWASRDERLALYDFALFADMDRHVTLSDRSRPLDQLTCTVLDAETTGLEPARGDRIVAIACVRVRNGAVRRAELLDVLVNPERPIRPENARIHGITDGMVAGAPRIDAIVPEVLRFADGTVLVGHHVWFDLMFLRETTERLGVPPLTRSHPVLDTSVLSQFLHGPLGRHDLETVAARLGVPTQGRHSARGDAVMTAEILVRLFTILRKRGIGTLGEALDATRRMHARSLPATGTP
jgi:DNA polymerase-3 subunit epsilon